MAENYFDSQEFQESLSRYTQSKRDGVSCYLDSDEFNNISDYYVENGMIDEACECLSIATQIHPDNLQLRVAYAGVTVCKNDFTKAEQLIQGIDESQAYDVLYIQAQLQCAIKNNYEEADRLFRRWIEHVDSDSDTPDSENFDEDDTPPSQYQDDAFDNESYERDARYKIIISFMELARKQRHKYIKKWLDNYISTFRPLGHYKTDYSIVDVCSELYYYDYLVKMLPEILDINPYLNNGWSLLGVSQQMCGKLDEAVTSLEYSLAINPDDAIANVSYGQCMFDRDNFQTALKHLLHFRQLTNDTSEDTVIGKCYYHLNDNENALKYFNTDYLFYTTLNPLKSSDVDRCLDLSEYIFACGDIDRAEDLIDAILAEFPTHHFTLMMKGCICLEKNLFYDSLDIFQQEMERYQFDIRVVSDVATRFLSYDYNAMAIYLLKSIEKQSLDNEYYLPFAILTMAYIKENCFDTAMEYLKVVCDHDLELTQRYFYKFIPETVQPSDYFDYLSEHLKKLMDTLNEHPQ